MVEQGKVSGFRLPPETLEKLDDLIEEGIIKNRTDGVIRAINRFHMKEMCKDDPFSKILVSITHSPHVTANWPLYDEQSNIVLVNEESGEHDYINKIGDNNARIARIIGNKKMIIKIEYLPNFIPDK